MNFLTLSPAVSPSSASPTAQSSLPPPDGFFGPAQLRGCAQIRIAVPHGALPQKTAAARRGTGAASREDQGPRCHRKGPWPGPAPKTEPSARGGGHAASPSSAQTRGPALPPLRGPLTEKRGPASGPGLAAAAAAKRGPAQRAPAATRPRWPPPPQGGACAAHHREERKDGRGAGTERRLREGRGAATRPLMASSPSDAGCSGA